MINRRHVMVAGAAATALPLAANAEPAAAFDAALNAAFDAVKPVALAGGLVTTQGLEWSGVKGVRRSGREASAQPGDRWHLGSNTKAMTAAVFARLVEQDRARWGMPLAEAFPGLTIDAGWDGAVVDDFMTHTAGLKDEAVMGAPWLMTARADPRSLPQQRRAIVEKALGAPPLGTRGTFEYGNANYVLVGAVIEAITGGSWEAAMQAELFTPLGLTSAGFGAPTGDNAWGHRRMGDAQTAMDPSDDASDNPLALGPAGTTHMTAGDYGRFLQVFLTKGDGWLKPETIQQLITPAPGQSYAYGWIALPPQPWAKGPVIAHEGSNTMWHALAIVDPAGSRALFGLSNDGGRGGPACQALAMGILRAL
ncbi:serine hydrolase domain-containing protein [Brevundimonas sp.]|uniref:serine hydrolase domain-containing protein n=1 Tax=Brevundimonas sp. TaxID=1871086 RepID=UPI00289B57B5|nr:serine hydrolase domain-containing protein [Brevundimonas sp.]